MKQLTFFIFSSILLLLLLSASILQLSSCNEEGNASKEFDPHIYYNTIENYTLSYKDCEIEDKNCTYISISYPVFEFIEEYDNINELNESINNIVFGKRDAKAENICEQFILEFDHFINDSILNIENYNQAWFDVRKAELTSVQKKVISYKCSISSFYGGAHPNEYVYLRNINPNTGDSLGLQMIFNEEAIKELSRLGERYFRKSKDLSPKESLETAGYWFNDDNFELSPNFAFTEQGLWFYYNDYEIAPYSMGHSEVILPYNLIMHLFE